MVAMFRPHLGFHQFCATAAMAVAFILLGPAAGHLLPGCAVAHAQTVDIEERRSLIFGKVATTSTPGSVTISPSGVKSVAGGVIAALVSFVFLRLFGCLATWCRKFCNFEEKFSIFGASQCFFIEFC